MWRRFMHPLFCMLLITSAGMLGGVANALITDNRFTWPRTENGVWCPGAFTNVFTGALAALCSWALYGSGAGIDLAHMSDRAEISLQLSAVVGAFLVGI